MELKKEKTNFEFRVRKSTVKRFDESFFIKQVNQVDETMVGEEIDEIRKIEFIR